MKAISEVAKDALALPSNQRVRRARSLLDSSDEDQELSPDVEAVWEDEICWRMKTVETGAARARPLNDVFADLDRRFPARLRKKASAVKVASCRF